MSADPGQYGGYGIRPRPPGSARHWLEPVPIFLDYLRDVGGASMVERFRKKATDVPWYGMSKEDRLDRRPLRPIFSSDVGHFDVVDMSEVLEEAHELVEHGMITPDELREFVFTNPVRLHTALNPDFFTGTVVEGAVAKLGAGA